MIFWIVWSIVGACMVLLFAGFVLPRVAMRAYAASMPYRDRPTGRVADEHGAVLFFEPSASVRRIIKSYRIGHDGGGLYFCGEWARKVAFVQYEIVVFSASGEIVQILRVKEKFNGDKTTHTVRLPRRTDYVCLRLLCVDDTPYPSERRKFNARYALWLAALCVLSALAVDLILWLGGTCAVQLLYIPAPDAAAWATLLGVSAAVVVLLICMFALGRFFLLRRKGEVYGE